MCLRGELRSLRANVGQLRTQAAEMAHSGGETLSAEHLAKEVQVMSQFQLLWAVFQSHSTAEDEIIWPALREKTSRGGQEGEAHSEADLGVVVNEHEYTEEHSQEHALFQGMEELLTGLRAARRSPQRRYELLTQLEFKTRETCTHLLAHLDKEETSALPLIKRFFSPTEMEALVGKIMGKRPSELMQKILTMMIKNLPPGDVGSMMGYMRQAVKDTYFEKWLASGGFSWDGLPQGGLQRKRSASTVDPPHDGSGSSGAGSAAGADDLASRCSLAREFTGVVLGSVEEGGCGGGSSSGSGGGGGCVVCELAGRCPRGAVPLTEAEFQAAVRRLGQVPNLPTSRKSALMQALRSDMYRSIKRARTDSEDAAPGPSRSDGAAASEACAGCCSAATCAEQRMSSALCPGACAAAAAAPAAPTAAAAVAVAPLTLPAGGQGRGVVRCRPGGLNLAPPRHYYKTAPASEGDDEEEEVVLAVGAAPLFPRAELEATWRQAPADGTRGMLGCPHYQRRTKLRAPCCGRLFTCRLCHDQVMDHTMDRYRVVEMLCMVCGALQPISGACAHAACPSNSSAAGAAATPGALEGAAAAAAACPCGAADTAAGTPSSALATAAAAAAVAAVPAAAAAAAPARRALSRYYCAICHLHDDDASKSIYHCPYCNVCRLGKGLGVDYCHCMKCNACVTVESADTHRCVTHSLESNCPICSTGMFESTQQVKGLRCGHFLHLNCYREYVRHAEEQAHWYRCPICLRSMEDMTEYFGQLDAVVAAQPMPPEYAGRRAKVLCHDCEAFTTVPYHLSGYHKCLACRSYNTRVEEQLAAPAVVSSPDASPDSASGGGGAPEAS